MGDGGGRRVVKRDEDWHTIGVPGEKAEATNGRKDGVLKRHSVIFDDGRPVNQKKKTGARVAYG